MTRDFRHALVVWLALLALLAATLAVSLLPFKELHTAANIGIAAAKAVLIGIVFMHLDTSSPLSRLIAAGGFLWLALLMGLALTDFWTRPITPLH